VAEYILDYNIIILFEIIKQSILFIHLPILFKKRDLPTLPTGRQAAGRQ
jgi:hypothetical protein